jgi:hypothetical protein
MPTTDLQIPFDSLPDELARRVPEYAGQDEAADLCISASLVTVTSEAEKDAAAKLAGWLAMHENQVENHFEPYKNAAHDLHQRICDRINLAINPLTAAKKKIGNAILLYNAEMRRRRNAEIAKAEEEARLKREEDKARIEKDLLERAQNCSAMGDMVGAEALLSEASQLIEELEAEPLQVVIPPIPEPQKAPGTITRQGQWDCRLMDKRALVMACAQNYEAWERLLLFDYKLALKELARRGEDFKAPGIETWQKDQKISFRSK